jgi:hypothetical protein
VERAASEDVPSEGAARGRGGGAGDGGAGGMEEDKAWRAQMLAEIIDTKQRVQASEAVISAFTVRGPQPRQTCPRDTDSSRFSLPEFLHRHPKNELS